MRVPGIDTFWLQRYNISSDFRTIWLFFMQYFLSEEGWKRK